jgi:beta-N-acetylhexosaminidase
MRTGRRIRGALIGLAVTAVAGCTSGGLTSGSGTGPATTPDTTPTSAPATSVAPPSSSAPDAPASSSTAPLSAAQRAFNAMSERERVGQLLMIDCPSTAVAAATLTAITKYHVGSVILDGTSTSGLPRTAAVTAGLQHAAPASVQLMISTDQEGGEVQRLQGAGFSSIPSGLVQGTIAPATLQRDAQTWGTQLRRAGVDVDLSPVLDTVPANSPGNPPIGDLDREFGHTPAVVSSHGVAVVKGLAAAGVAATVKHFPSLGRVSGNTDTTSGVTDHVTTRTDAYLAPFAAAVQVGTPFVMMSTAIYARIDATHPAAFSSTIITGMLRGDLGFTGVVISDDLGQAAQVRGYAVGTRAVDFIAAGGDLVLTVVASQAKAMTAALLAKADADPAFKAKVDAAALTVLREKQALGLLH